MRYQVQAEDKIERLWKAFTQTGELEPGSLNPVIENSWRRCYESAVNPYDGASHYILDKRELENVLEKRKELLRVALPLMEKLYRFVAGSGFIVMLTDERGFILEAQGDQETLDDAMKMDFIKGAAWTEEEVGTNAIGTILYARHPLQVTGCEHYCSKHHRWTCSAAPIFDEQGDMIGILDMSGPQEKTHPHTLGIVVSAVEAIIFQMRIQQKNHELILSNNRLRNVFMTMSDGVIILDKTGQILQVNPVTTKTLGHTSDFFEKLPMKTILPFCEKIQKMLETGQDFNDVETVMQGALGPVHVVASAKPIRDERGLVTGGVIIFNPLKKIRNLVNRFSGAQASFQFADIIGKSQLMRESVQIASLAADRNSNVLLQGESGTGKELFAQAIHNRSARQNGPFVALNCGAIPRELLGSELFGYVEGAFTGARKGGRPGKFELASGGTLFLDEIAEMPLGKQVSLLRAIQEREITRIGDDKVIPVNVRIICASNKNLQKEVEKENFRKDLYYRLNVISLTLPSLRERTEDIPVLFYYFLEEICKKLELSVPHVDKGMMDYLIRYNWPGNIREIENVVERIIILGNGQTLTPDLLPQEITNYSHLHDVNQAEVSSISISEVREKKKQSAADVEQEEILRLLSKHGGNISHVAQELGVSRNTVYRKMKRYKIKI